MRWSIPPSCSATRSSTSLLVVSANASAFTKVHERPRSAASAAVSAVRYHPAVAVRRAVGAFSKDTPIPSTPYRARPAMVVANPYPELEPITRAVRRSGVRCSTCAAMSRTVRAQPAGCESRNRNPRPRGLITRSVMLMTLTAGSVPVHLGVVGLQHDIGAQPTQVAGEIRVAAMHMMGRRHQRLALGRQPGQHQRRTRTDVRRNDRSPGKPGYAANHRVMPIGLDLRAEPGQLLRER